MRLVVTMMVRDEVDIISAMVEHHVAQGVDQLIVTDNASVDGTTEVLEDYASQGILELHHDPEHRKQQHSVVTAMARRARTRYAADWVINADADEFFVPVDKDLTLRQALEQVPLTLGAFTARVVNLVGPPAWHGSGINRLEWRDHRSEAELRSVGIYAHPTPSAIHRGDPSVIVAQGNHFVSLQSHGQPAPALAIEVLHLPWRSWAQLERKVRNAGLGYAANPELKPSRNHHGMADYRRYLGGRLQLAYFLRSPLMTELVEDQRETPFLQDDWLSQHVATLVDRAALPHHLEACLGEPTDVAIPESEHARGAELGAQFHQLEQQTKQLQETVEQYRARVQRLTAQVRRLRRELADQKTRKTRGGSRSNSAKRAGFGREESRGH